MSPYLITVVPLTFTHNLVSYLVMGTPPVDTLKSVEKEGCVPLVWSMESAWLLGSLDGWPGGRLAL